MLIVHLRSDVRVLFPDSWGSEAAYLDGKDVGQNFAGTVSPCLDLEAIGRSIDCVSDFSTIVVGVLVEGDTGFEYEVKPEAARVGLDLVREVPSGELVCVRIGPIPGVWGVVAEEVV